MELRSVFQQAHDAGKNWAIGGAVLGLMTKDLRYIFACAAIGYVVGALRGGYKALTGPEPKAGP